MIGDTCDDNSSGVIDKWVVRVMGVGLMGGDDVDSSNMMIVEATTMGNEGWVGVVGLVSG